MKYARVISAVIDEMGAPPTLICAAQYLKCPIMDVSGSAATIEGELLLILKHKGVPFTEEQNHGLWKYICSTD